MASVYCPKRGRASSSPLLVRGALNPAAALSRDLDVRGRGHFHPFGLTPYPSVRRLLPNHYLDLADFACRRHWPDRNGMAAGEDEVEQTLTSFARKLRDNVGAMVEAFPIQMSLTAGRDSRTLLAAARPYASGVAFFTTAIPDPAARLDCRVAGELARRCALHHRVLPWREPQTAELESWQQRVGHCVAGRTWRSVRTLKQLDPRRVLLPGTCAEVGRAYYWRRDDLHCEGLDPEEAVSRLGLPRAPALVEAAEAWLSELPAWRRADILDLLYLEQRLGCWAGPAQYGHASAARVTPLADRRPFSLMFDLPRAYRYRQRLPDDLIRILWPDLRRLPFNRKPGLRGAAGEVRRRASTGLRRIPGGRAARAWLGRAVGRGGD